MKALKIHILGIKLAFAARMAYRADFFISTIIIFAGDLIIPIATFLIYRSGASFPGWNLYEVLMIQGIFMFARGIASSLFFGIVWNTLLAVREGTYDLIRLKPHPTLHIGMAVSFDCENLGIVFGGIVLCIIAFLNLPAISLMSLAAFLGMLILSIIVLVSFALIMSALVFKWVGNTRVYEIFESVVVFGQYPQTIFSKVFANLLAWIIPISMIASIPAAVLLGKPVVGVLPAILVSILFFLLSIFFWHFMEKKYTSAGG